MHHIQCPDRLSDTQRDNNRWPESLFLAGGITGCSDWQKSFEQLLHDTPGILLNPRREDFPGLPEWSVEIEKEQVEWEHDHFMLADAHAFFFPAETLCPITLFELGKVLALDKPLFVGMDGSYKKRHNVQIQLRIVRPGVSVVWGIHQLAEQVDEFIQSAIQG